MGAGVDIIEPAKDPETRVPLTLERVALAVAMGAMVLITFANVLTRYLTNMSLAFTEEYSVVLMVVVTMVGSAYAFAGRRHVRIDYFVNLLPVGARRSADLAGLVLALALSGVLVGYGAKLAWDTYRFDVLTPGLGHPEWIYVATVPVLGLAILGRIVGCLLRMLREGRAAT